MLLHSEPEWTVALVCDQPEAKEMIGYALKAMFPRTQVIEPRSPYWLLEQIASLPLTAIITTYKLFGELDGLKLAKELRTRGFSRPILMLSSSSEIAPRSRDAGIDEFLPFDRWLELPARLACLISAEKLFQPAPPIPTSSASDE